MTHVIKVSQLQQTASAKQLHFINRLIFQKAANENKILAFFNVHSLENLSKVKARELIDMLMKMPLQEHITNELYGNEDPTRSDQRSDKIEVA